MSLLVEKISKDFFLSAQEVSTVIKTAPNRYKVYQISKRNGRGKRTIAQPARDIKAFQRWFAENYLYKMPVHEAAIAYKTSLSIRDNAIKHVNSNFILKMDFKNFFPSIVPDDLRSCMVRIFDEAKDDKFWDDVKRLLFWEPIKGGGLRLSIGAPSSPSISNIVMYEFDVEISLYCSLFDINYTRYADDLVFSSVDPNKLDDIKEYVKKICSDLQSPKLEVNNKKTVNVSRRHRRLVTGLIITPDNKISVGRQKKRLIRSQVHRFANGNLVHTEIEKLAGEIAFLGHIEPKFIYSIVTKYGNGLLTSLKKKAQSKFDLKEDDESLPF